MNDLITELDQVRQSVGRDTAAQAGHVVELRRTYDVPVGDVWDACTSPARISRWFLPLTGASVAAISSRVHGSDSVICRSCSPGWGASGPRSPKPLRRS